MVKRARPAGFTLVEVMMTVVILGIIGSVGARMMVQANRYFIFTKTRADLQSQARAVMYIITRELHQAQSDTITVDRASTSQPFYSRITFTTPEGTRWQFEQSGNQLIQTVNSTKKKTLTSDLTYLAFSFPRSDDLTIISVDMTLTQSIYQGKTKALHMASEKVQVMN